MPQAPASNGCSQPRKHAPRWAAPTPSQSLCASPNPKSHNHCAAVLVLLGSSASVLRGGWLASGSLTRHEGPRFLPIQDDLPAAKPATPLLSLRWTLSAKRACVVITDTEPDRLALLPPPAPMGLRGVWVVAARCRAGPGAVLAPTHLRGVWHVHAQTCAHSQGAVFIQGRFEGRPQTERIPASTPSEFEAGAGARAAARTDRRHH